MSSIKIIIVTMKKPNWSEVDQLDLDEIDESSCHSWSEPVQGKSEVVVVASVSTNQKAASRQFLIAAKFLSDIFRPFSRVFWLLK